MATTVALGAFPFLVLSSSLVGVTGLPVIPLLAAMPRWVARGGVDVRVPRARVRMRGA